jgi:chloramphenicol-sensitive protein RarD
MAREREVAASRVVNEQAQAEADATRGFFAALSAFTIWGLIPLYLRPLAQIDALQIMTNRALWCCLFCLGWLGVRGELHHVRTALANTRTRNTLAVTALCASTNWLLYVWAVTHGHVVEGSLGYFINPLVNVLLGVLVLGERLNRVQTAAVALAGIGVAYITWAAGRPPWIALTLAGTFGLYGLLRKVVSVDALAGLAAETTLIAPFVAGYLVYAELTGIAALFHVSPAITALLFAGGVVTAVPLALFSYGARRIPYSTLGILQYVGPTLQLMFGLFLYREPMSPERLAGFSLIWLALALYAGDGIARRRVQNKLVASAPKA